MGAGSIPIASLKPEDENHLKGSHLMHGKFKPYLLFILAIIVACNIIAFPQTSMAAGQLLSPYQSIAAGGADNGKVFQINGETYLVLAYNKWTPTRVWKWVNGSFTFFQELPKALVKDVEAFSIDGVQYLALANGYYTGFSPIYRWDGTQFVFHQDLPSVSAESVKSVQIGNDTFLALANHFNSSNGASTPVDSVIFKWNGTQFQAFQNIPAVRAMCWQKFSAGGDQHLVLTSLGYDPSGVVKLFKWDGSQFSRIQSFGSAQSFSLVPFELNGQIHLAAYREWPYPNSLQTFVWNGTELVSDATYPYKGDDITWNEPFRVGNEQYLFSVSNWSQDGSDSARTSYIYWFHNGEWREVQQVNTFATAHVISAAIEGNVYVIVPYTYDSHTGNGNLPTIVYRANYDYQPPAAVPPVARAGEDLSSRPNAAVTLNGTTSFDPDSTNPLSYSWSVTEKPDGSTAVLSSPASGATQFSADLPGKYAVRLVVTDSEGNPSLPDDMFVTIYNTAPVASAGNDISVQTLGQVVSLSGAGSYDPDGDPISYSWTFSAKPVGSTAVLVNPTSAYPTFAVDKHGEYTVSLVISDPWVSSAPKSIKVSFTNLPPVADAGSDQITVQGTSVTLDGTKSLDPNTDPIEYQWTISSLPLGSNAVLVNGNSDKPTIVPDLAGTYSITLVVDDGIDYSIPDTVNIVVRSYQDLAGNNISTVSTIASNFAPGVFQNSNGKLLKPFLSKLSVIASLINTGNYLEALDKLEQDLLAKTNGCALTSTPDANDWLQSCQAQESIYPLLINAADMLRSLTK